MTDDPTCDRRCAAWRMAQGSREALYRSQSEVLALEKRNMDLATKLGLKDDEIQKLQDSIR